MATMSTIPDDIATLELAARRARAEVEQIEAEAAKLEAEAHKLMAEQLKLALEALSLRRWGLLAVPVGFATVAVAAGAGLSHLLHF